MGKKTLGTPFLFPFCLDEGTLQATLFVACWESSDDVSDNVCEDVSDEDVSDDVFNEGTLRATLFVAFWESNNVSAELYEDASEDASDGSGGGILVSAMAVRRFNVNWH